MNKFLFVILYDPVRQLHQNTQFLIKLTYSKKKKNKVNKLYRNAVFLMIKSATTGQKIAKLCKFTAFSNIVHCFVLTKMGTSFDVPILSVFLIDVIRLGIRNNAFLEHFLYTALIVIAKAKFKIHAETVVVIEFINTIWLTGWRAH